MTESSEQRGERLLAEHDRLIDQYGQDRSTWPAGQATNVQRIEKGLLRVADEIDEAARRDSAKWARVRAAELDPSCHENGFGGGHGDLDGHHARSRTPWAGLGDDVSRSDSYRGLSTRAHDALTVMGDAMPDAGRERLARMLDADKSLDTAAFVLSASDPAYTRAFVKILGNEHGYRTWTPEEAQAYTRVEAVRAVMAESSTAALLVPIPLDPSIVLTNTGSINPIRDLARKETTAYATWTGVSSAGVTAAWVPENTALTEGSGTFSAISVTPKKLSVYLTASYEVFQDTNISAQLPQLIGDAFNRTEADAWITGNGTTQPLGVITAVSATAGSLVTATTRGSFTSASAIDVYNVDSALPARARAGRPRWVANRATINTIRSMSASGNGSSFWANFGDSTPIQLLDHGIAEASSVTASTVSGSFNLILGDFSQYLIVDRIGTQIEYVQNVVDTNGVPTATRGWIAWKRTSATVTNLDAFRLLKC